MKKIIFNMWTRPFLIFAVCAFFVLAGCSDSDNTSADTDVIPLTGVGLSIGEQQGTPGGQTRAVSGFVVNTGDDPTFLFTEKQGWTLDLIVYDKNDQPYAEGQDTFLWNGTYWAPQNPPLYMPNYLQQSVTAELHPAGWGGTISTDQTDRATFIEQDILVQNGLPFGTATPAHYLQVELRHAHSMIDLVLAEVNPADIASVTVEADNLTYEPYKVPGLTREEYLVILPLGVNNPVVRVTTNAGAKYSKELDIPSTAVNTCYYVRLVGLELILEGITVSNWAYGRAVDGDYTTVTSYPTFRGPVGLEVTVYYSSGTNQTITFNEKGEALEKPAGRTITAVETAGGKYTLPVPYTIRTMIVDLNNYISMI